MKLKHNTFLGTTNEKFNLEFCSISIVNYNKPVSEEWHSHEDIHLSLILQGGNLESRKKQDTQVSSGKIIAYNQGEIHRNRFTAFPSKNLNLEFNSDFFSKNHLNFNDLNLSETKNIEAYLDLIHIYSELHVNDSYTSNSIQLSIKSLFTTKDISSKKPIWIKRLREIIEDRWNEFIPLDELALILNVHPVTISKYFRKYYNGSLGDYMRKVKVQKALHFLFHTDMPITEIAFTCGFSDHSHMIRVFKRYVGYNPKIFRKF
ncbi:helix-turn-helix transcriptional regulator [Aquimarina algiphila]|uniref:helix-turn-helix transcriptional regulator n=1 Tax=Aquimarina algiphila TaxID=2047982 RepID=UPI00232A9514|nr:helix-turn-helix transcriptional regulator [Aquimarina algiphila]